MAEEIIFKTVVDTAKSVKETDKLTDAIEKTNEELEKTQDKGAAALAALNAKVEAGNYSLKEGSKLIKQYTDLVLQAGRESPVGQAAIKAAGDLKDKLGDLRAEIVAAGTDGANLKAGLQLASTVTAGYGALQGAIALVGDENKDMAKTLVKLQAVTSILAGIESIRGALEKESLLVIKGKVVWNKILTAGEYVYALAVGTTTGAMKALRIAMLSIPIIAIIAAIVALVAALAMFMSEEKKAEQMNNDLNESFEKMNRVLEHQDSQYKRNSDNKRKLMEADKATAEEMLAFDKQRLLDEEKARQENTEFLYQAIRDKQQAQNQANKEGNAELYKTIEDEIQAQRDKLSKLLELEGQYVIDTKLLEKKYEAEKAKDKEDTDKKASDKAKEWAKKKKEEDAKAAQLQLDQQRLLEDLLLYSIEDTEARKLAAQKLAQERERQDLVKKYGENAALLSQLEVKQAADRKVLRDEITKQNIDDIESENKREIDKRKAADDLRRKDEKSSLEGKLIMMRKDFDSTIMLKRELALLDMEQELENTDLTEGEKYKIKQEYSQKIDDLNKEVADKEKERQKQVQEAAKSVLQQGMNAAQGLAEAYFDWKISTAKKGSADELALEKKKFEINKKLQIAQAIIQGIQATLAAYSSGAAIPVVGVVAGPAFAAAAAVTAALNVAKIKNTQFEGGSNSTSTPSTSAPSVNVTQLQPNGPSTLTDGLQGSENNNVHKVVLVDSDLKAAIQDSSQVKVISGIG